MKERPILFSAPMVRELLDGSKTQTRRTIKIQPSIDSIGHFIWNGMNFGQEIDGKPCVRNFIKFHCPYGKVGDRLWVRESFSVVGFSEGHETSTEAGFDFEPAVCIVKYPADGTEKLIDDLVYENDSGADEIAQAHRASKKKSVPSIHMPRWASRINLEITGVRVERLNDISEADAKAEGMKFTDYGLTCFHQGRAQDVGACPAPDAHHQKRPGWHYDKSTHQDQCWHTAKYAFSALWESINGAGSWSANPWVWVVEFKRV